MQEQSLRPYVELESKLATTGTDGEVANALVCKTSIHGFKSHSVLQQFKVIATVHDLRIVNDPLSSARNGRAI